MLVSLSPVLILFITSFKVKALVIDLKYDACTKTESPKLTLSGIGFVISKILTSATAKLSASGLAYAMPTTSSSVTTSTKNGLSKDLDLTLKS